MLTQLGIGSAMILSTTIIHGLFTASGLGFLRRRYLRKGKPETNWHASVVVATFVLWLFLATIVEIWVWAGLFLVIGAIETMEEALYFSTVTMTTLGYGDIVPRGHWRLLASFEAANGLFLFGWSTALVFTVVQWLYEAR